MHASVPVLGCHPLSFHKCMLHLHMTCNISQVQPVQELYGAQIRVYMVHRLAVGARPTPRLLQCPIGSANELAMLLCTCRIVSQQALSQVGLTRSGSSSLERGQTPIVWCVGTLRVRGGDVLCGLSGGRGFDAAVQRCWGLEWLLQAQCQRGSSTTGTARTMRMGNLHTQVTAATPYRTESIHCDPSTPPAHSSTPTYPHCLL